MSDDPRVSVAICTYNRPHYLREAVESVLAQTFADLELIICDDASTDGETPQLCRELEQRDPRVRVLRHPENLGMIGNWNSGLLAARGRYYAKLDDDNRYLPTFLEKTVGMLQQTPGACFAFTDESYIDGAGAPLEQMTEKGSKEYHRVGLVAGLLKDTALGAVRQSCGINSALFVRQALADAGGFRALGGTIADLDVFLNIAAHGGLGCYVPERLSEYRFHEEMGTSDLVVNIQKARQAIAMWEANLFQGEAEHLRRVRLSSAYVSLTRTLLLNSDIRAAREAIREARRHDPTGSRALLTWILLCLPGAFLNKVLRWRYGKHIDALSQRQKPTPVT